MFINATNYWKEREDLIPLPASAVNSYVTIQPQCHLSSPLAIVCGLLF